MAKRTIETNLDPKGNNKRSISVEVDYPDTLADLVKRFGETIVYEKFTDAHDVALQAFIRTQMGKTGDKRMNDGAIKKAVSEWKPTSRKSPDPAKKMETLQKLMSGLSKEDRAALMKQFATQSK